MANFLVTGGAGFIGSHIAEYLVSLGHKVIVVDNLSTGKLDNLSGIIDEIEFVEQDIRDKRELYEVVEKVDHIIHQAAEISTDKSINTPELCNAVNVDGTLNLLVIARDCGIKRFVLASSAAVYGDTDKQPQHELSLPKPLSPYGVTKICAEHYAEVFRQLYGLETVRLRYFNAYGPRQNPHSEYAAVVPKFIDRALKGQDLHIYGDGEQTRDFVFVENIAHANYLACISDNAPGNAYNIASGHSISIGELASTIVNKLESKSKIIYEAPKIGDIKHSVSTTRRAEEELGYSLPVNFDEGLKRTIDYLTAL